MFCCDLGKYSIFYDYHKNMVICVHVQTVDTRPLFQEGIWPGYEATRTSTFWDVFEELIPHLHVHSHRSIVTSDSSAHIST